MSLSTGPKFCVNAKTDIRFLDSYKRAEPDFLVLPTVCIIQELYSVNIEP